MSLSSRRKPKINNKPKVVRPKADPIRTCRKAMPQSELGFTVDLTFHFSAKHPTRKDDISLKGSKPFSDTPPKDHVKLFQHKIKECMKMCDFSDPNKDLKAKVTKTQLLNHIDECFKNAEYVKSITAECAKDLIQMVSVNIFRRLPINPIAGPFDAKDSVIDDGWPHISLAYNCLLSSFSCLHTGNYITQSFIYKLIGNGISLDDNERAKVCEVLKAIYVRYMNLRVGMRKSIGFHFQMHRCSNELLQFYCSMIDGFNSPLKTEHTKFFKECLNTIHSHPKYNIFYDSYIECLSRMIDKQASLLEEILKYMRQHWPYSERIKQLVYLNEVELLLTQQMKNLSPETVKTAFQIVNFGIFNEFSDIVDKSIDILTNPKIIDVLLKYSSVIFPIVVDNLLRIAKAHWDVTITGNSMVALQALNEVNAEIFRKVNEQRLAFAKTKKSTMSNWNAKWLKILDSAKAADPGIENLNFSSFPRAANAA